MHIIICIFVVFCSVMCWLCLFRTHRTNNKESRADVLCATANSWNALKSVIWYGLGPKAEDAAAIGGDKCSSMFRSWLKAHDEHSRHVQCANKEQPPHTHTHRMNFPPSFSCVVALHRPRIRWEFHTNRAQCIQMRFPYHRTTISITYDQNSKCLCITTFCRGLYRQTATVTASCNK